MAVGGAMDLSFSLLSSFLFLPFPRLWYPGAWCMWCFHEVYRMTDMSRRGGRLTGWLGDRHPHGGLTWTINTHTHNLIRSATHFPPFFHIKATECIVTTIINVIRKSFTTSFPPRRSCCLIYHWHMLVPEWPPWEKHDQSKLLKDILTGQELYFITLKGFVLHFDNIWGLKKRLP